MILLCRNELDLQTQETERLRREFLQAPGDLGFPGEEGPRAGRDPPGRPQPPDLGDLSREDRRLQPLDLRAPSRDGRDSRRPLHPGLVPLSGAEGPRLLQANRAIRGQAGEPLEVPPHFTSTGADLWSFSRGSALSRHR